MNRKQRRAEGKSGKNAGHPVQHASNSIEQTVFAEALGHHQAGRFREAEAGYRHVLASNPRHSGALGYLGLLAHQAGHSEAGIDLLRKAIAADRRNADIHYNLARVLSDCGRDDEAIAQNRKVLELKPDYPGAHTNLGALLLLQGRSGEALDVVMEGLRSEDSAALKSSFVMALRSLDPNEIKIRGNFIPFLVRALTEPWTRPRDLAAVAGEVLLRRPVMARSRERLARDGVPPRPEDLFSGEDLATLGREGLLEALLGTAPVVTLALEEILTGVRRALLAAIDADALTDSDAWLPLASAIARQGFINEYVFAVSSEEDGQVQRLRENAANRLERSETVAPIQLAVLAGYLPLHSLAGADRLAAHSWTEPVRAVVMQQVTEPREEQNIRLSVERLTVIDNAVSEKVQAQYEENPYPRWTRLFAGTQVLPIDHYIQAQFPGVPYRAHGNGSLDILIAGCGTGLHAIQRALQFRSANILAIDLSASSLSYAIRKSKELGLTNIRYAQADLLALDGSRTFDVIDSSGVLHHLDKPFDGWRKLAALLRPNGLMHVGLYSAIARKDINTARAWLAEQGRSYSVAEVRRLRRDFAQRPPSDPLHKIAGFSDFFSMSECRDLLFHVQEHQLSIPEIAAFLKENGFAFLGFETPARPSYLRRFPGDRMATDLANWHVFETENPATFARMYQFWVQKI